MTAVAEDYIDRVKAIVLDALADYPVTVYLYGSRATGTARRASDVDVAVDAHQPLPPATLADLREALEESTIPYHVDVVDLTAAGARLRDRVRQEGIVWKDSANDSTPPPRR